MRAAVVREVCDQVCNESVFVTHWWSGKIFFANVSFEILYKHSVNECGSLVSLQGMASAKGWEGWFLY